MENALGPAEAGSPSKPPPSFGAIVLKQTVRVTVVSALVWALILGALLTSITTVAPLGSGPQTGILRWVYAFLVCALYGLMLGAAAGLVCGLISGLMRAYKSAREPAAALGTAPKEPAPSPPAQ